jgi:hypothetical protein
MLAMRGGQVARRSAVARGRGSQRRSMIQMLASKVGMRRPARTLERVKVARRAQRQRRVWVGMC